MLYGKNFLENCAEIVLVKQKASGLDFVLVKQKASGLNYNDKGLRPGFPMDLISFYLHFIQPSRSNTVAQ